MSIFKRTITFIAKPISREAFLTEVLKVFGHTTTQVNHRSCGAISIYTRTSVHLILKANKLHIWGSQTEVDKILEIVLNVKRSEALYAYGSAKVLDSYKKAAEAELRRYRLANDFCFTPPKPKYLIS